MSLYLIGSLMFRAATTALATIAQTTKVAPVSQQPPQLFFSIRRLDHIQLNIVQQTCTARVGVPINKEPGATASNNNHSLTDVTFREYKRNEAGTRRVQTREAPAARGPAKIVFGLLLFKKKKHLCCLFPSNDGL